MRNFIQIKNVGSSPSRTNNYTLLKYSLNLNYAGLEELVNSSAFHAGDYGFEPRVQYLFNALVVEWIRQKSSKLFYVGSSPTRCTRQGECYENLSK